MGYPVTLGTLSPTTHTSRRATSLVGGPLTYYPGPNCHRHPVRPTRELTFSSTFLFFPDLRLPRFRRSLRHLFPTHRPPSAVGDVPPELSALSRAGGRGRGVWVDVRGRVVRGPVDKPPSFCFRLLPRGVGVRGGCLTLVGGSPVSLVTPTYLLRASLLTYSPTHPHTGGLVRPRPSRES